MLNSVLDPPQQIPPPLTRAEIARQERSTITERAKDRWNEEIEKGVRWLQNTDWDAVRENAEDKIASALGITLQKSREGIEEGERRAKPYIDEAGKQIEHGTTRVKDEGHRIVNDAAKGAIRGVEEAKVYADAGAAKAQSGIAQASAKVGETSQSAKDAGKKAFSTAKAKANEVVSSSEKAAERGAEHSKEAIDQARTKAATAGPGTVDAIRNTVRDTVNKGIEKGRELVDKTKEVVGMASDKVGAAVNGAPVALSAEEKAFKQRYEKTPKTELEKSVEQVLAARYTPEKDKDHTSLRGL